MLSMIRQHELHETGHGWRETSSVRGGSAGRGIQHIVWMRGDAAAQLETGTRARGGRMPDVRGAGIWRGREGSGGAY